MLTPEQRARYNEQGFLLVKGMFTTDEARALREECHTLATRLSVFTYRRNL